MSRATASDLLWSLPVSHLESGLGLEFYAYGQGKSAEFPIGSHISDFNLPDRAIKLPYRVYTGYRVIKLLYKWHCTSSRHYIIPRILISRTEPG